MKTLALSMYKNGSCVMAIACELGISSYQVAGWINELEGRL